MLTNRLLETDDGKSVVPSSDSDWLDWVSATSTRNYVLGDPLLDWLDLFGAAHGYERDEMLPRYDSRTDFTEFIFEQGRRFESAVVKYLLSLEDVVRIVEDLGEVRELAAAEKTLSAMEHGVPIIHQGVLRNPQYRTYGMPDLLIRSDVLGRLFPDALDEEAAGIPAPAIAAAAWHYRVVDVKFTTLHLSATGLLTNRGSCAAYKVQLYIYNEALGRLQGFEPESSFLLGRGWEQTVKGIASRGFSCLERLAPVPQNGTIAGKRLSADEVAAALEWIRTVRHEGSEWTLLPKPSRPELYPNLGNLQDGPWHAAKRRIAEELEDLTLLWQVGVPGRRQGHAAGVFRWRDPKCTPDVVGVTGAARPSVLQALMDINRSSDGEHVRPARINTAETEWRPVPPLEFYVDFETVNDLADDFSAIPQRGGQTMIYMIGCGHIENDEWRFSCFIADELTEAFEANIIDSWFAHMESVRKRIAPDHEPRVVHWSPAEISNFETAYNSARERHPDNDWPSPRWFDFLNRVMKTEPVVVRGAMAFGLKSVAKGMFSHGFIETLWDDGPADGLGAMVGAWWCQDEARRLGKRLWEINLMKEITDYNEVDCCVMMEAIRYLRLRH
jgi:hypothetical protein